MTLIPKGQLIAVNFPAGAGGKMLQNCIGLSRHCALVHRESAAWQLAWTGACTDEYYQIKLRHMLTSLPKTMGSHWLDHEFLTQDLFGIDHTGFIAESPVAPVVYRLAEKGIWVTTTAHNYDYVNERLTRYWPVIRCVDVVNNEQFAKTWLPIKNGNLQYDCAWNTQGRTPGDKCFEFNLDSCIHDTTAFVEQIGKLYDHLEFDDFKPQLLAQFHERYIKLHQ